MRILHITPDYHPSRGGGELFARQVSERLAMRGHDVAVLALNSRGASQPDGGSLPRVETIGGVRVRRLNRSLSLRERLMRVRGAYRFLDLAVGPARTRMLSVTPVSPLAFALTLRARPDVVAVFNWYHLSLAYQTAVACDIARCAFVGVPFLHTEYSWAGTHLLHETLSRCDAVAVMTEHEKRFVEYASGPKPAVSVVGAGVNADDFATRDGARVRAELGIGDAPLIGYVGRIVAEKGVVRTIHAMADVWRYRPSARLLLAGWGSGGAGTLEPDVTEALSQLSPEDRSRVITMIPMPDSMKSSVFDALDVFVMPSLAESFGIAYLEAWLCGKPVVGSRIGSTECVIREGVDGLLVDPVSPTDLADALNALLDDPATGRRLGRNGQERTLASFLWDHVTQRLESVYVDAVVRSGRGSTASRPRGRR